VDVTEPPPLPPVDWLRVDLGIVNIASDSDSEMYSGGHVNRLLKHHSKIRQHLQQKGTKSAKRLVFPEPQANVCGVIQSRRQKLLG